jgi:hypothetical protein
MSTDHEHDGGIEEAIIKLRDLAEKNPTLSVRSRLVQSIGDGGISGRKHTA